MPGVRPSFFSAKIALPFHPTYAVNPHLSQLQPYPFEKLPALFAGVTPNPQYKLSIGEPQHPTPAFVSLRLPEHLLHVFEHRPHGANDLLMPAVESTLLGEDLR